MNNMNCKSEISETLENIFALYNNEDILVESSQAQQKNIAVDTESKTRIIKLIDPKIETEDHKIYIPGTVYLTSYLGYEEKIKTRRKILRGADVNTYPEFVDSLIRSWTPKGRIEDLEKELEKGSVYSKEFPLIKEELLDLWEIAPREYGKRKNKEAVFLSDLSPFKAVTEFEYDGTYHGNDKLRCIEIPFKIRAYEADFTFQSNKCVKISDGTTFNLGRYKNGLLTLKDISLMINDIDISSRKESSSLPLALFKLLFVIYSAFNGSAGAEEYHLYSSIRHLRKAREIRDAHLKISFYGNLKSFKEEPASRIKASTELEV